MSLGKSLIIASTLSLTSIDFELTSAFIKNSIITNPKLS